MIRCVHCMQTISATHPPTPLFRALFGVVSCRVVSFPFFSKFKKERRKEKKRVVFNLPLPPPLSVFSLALVASRRIASHCVTSCARCGGCCGLQAAGNCRICSLLNRRHCAPNSPAVASGLSTFSFSCCVAHFLFSFAILCCHSASHIIN